VTGFYSFLWERMLLVTGAQPPLAYPPA
jgi:hypothetical protein